jgi:hypothetical protein
MKTRVIFRRLLVMSLLMSVEVGGWSQGPGRPGVKIGRCPLRGGVIVIGNYHYVDAGPGVEVLGKDSVVVAAYAGKVVAIFDVGDNKAVMILSGRRFYTYDNLDCTLVLKGGMVKSGQLIGTCQDKKTDFIVSDSTGREFSPQRTVDCQVTVLKPNEY